MTINAILEIADHGGDELVQNRADGDPFAVCLAHELEESFDPEARDLIQLTAAFRTVERLILALDDVKDAFMAEFVERRNRA